jgi:hypothetical protein
MESAVAVGCLVLADDACQETHLGFVERGKHATDPGQKH